MEPNVQINLHNVLFPRTLTHNYTMKKHRDVLQMQLNMLVKARQYCAEHDRNPNTRQASGLQVTDPRTGIKYRVVG